ncbi:MAG: hypothetical protein HOF99_12020 [Rhodospirillaceae bacterium]|nr:hypothetical protein [Rhodospirillaceae bacterium]
MFPGEITLDGKPTPVIWGSALGVPEKYRATGIGLMLAMKMQTVGAWMGAFGVSQIALPLYTNLRWVNLSLPRYVLVRRSRRFLAALTGSEALAAILAPIADAAFAVQRAGRTALSPVHRRYELVPAPEMPEELADRFVAHAKEQGGAAPHRSPAWINWLLTTEFNAVPTRRTNLHLVRRKGTVEISGYILTKQRHFDDVTQRHVKDVTIAAVQDWMSFDDALPEHHLLALAINAALTPAPEVIRGSTADAVEICTADPAEQRALRRWGLVGMGQLNFLCKPARGADLADDKWRDPANWRLRPAEGDNFWT